MWFTLTRLVRCLKTTIHIMVEDSKLLCVTPQSGNHYHNISRGDVEKSWIGLYILGKEFMQSLLTIGQPNHVIQWNKLQRLRKLTSGQEVQHYRLKLTFKLTYAQLHTQNLNNIRVWKNIENFCDDSTKCLLSYTPEFSHSKT